MRLGWPRLLIIQGVLVQRRVLTIKNGDPATAQLHLSDLPVVANDGAQEFRDFAGFRDLISCICNGLQTLTVLVVSPSPSTQGLKSIGGWSSPGKGGVSARGYIVLKRTLVIGTCVLQDRLEACIKKLW